MKKAIRWLLDKTYLMTALCMSPMIIMAAMCDRSNADMAALIGGGLAFPVMLLLTWIDDKIN